MSIGLKNPAFLEPVRKNLQMMHYYLHPNGEVVYFNGTDLSEAQKVALTNQYQSILDRFTSKDKDFNLSNPMAQQYLLDEDTKANTYVANFIKRLAIPKAQITNNSKAFSDVSKMISTIKDINIRYKAIDVLKGIVNMNSQTSRVKP
jgi:hypothetical protein